MRICRFVAPSALSVVLLCGFRSASAEPRALPDVAIPVVAPREGTPEVARVEKRFHVTIRAVEARPAPAEVEPGSHVVVDERLSDLRHKLAELDGFQRFSLISSFERNLGLKQLEQIDLVGGQTLRIKPIAFENRRLCLWIRWQGPEGEEILDTRLHFNVSDGVLAGMESESGKESLILAVNAQQLE